MHNYKTILGIETSCDETAAAVLQKDEEGIRVLSNVVASSSELQATFGGVIPEQAAREQLKAIIPVIETAIKNSGLTIEEIDAIAVTYGPGLIGSLLIGVETAKTLALIWKKPLIPVNHLLGHFYANWINQGQGTGIKYYGEERMDSKPLNTYPLMQIPTFPCIGLLVSGGHTDLVLFKDHMKYEYLGGTRDDAAGECFDKCARLMNLPYPGGPEISKLAKTGDGSKIKLPKPMINSGDFDFSFSGLKTAVSTYIKENLDYKKEDLAAAIEVTIIDVLIKKTIGAADKHQISEIMVAGGVAANANLSAGLRRFPHVIVRNPQKNFCTDNGAMIAAAGFFTKKEVEPILLQADPNIQL
jgi:N6-L-threonylcarbamoyladenine synthase